MNLESDALFMLDIETTGLDEVKDDIIQVAILRLEYENGLYRPNTHYVQCFPTSKQPSEWASKIPAQVRLYEKCHDLHQSGEGEDTATIRGHLTAFLGPKAPLVGINLPMFDLKFLKEKRYLLPSDYHYRVFDMTGIIEGVMRAFGKKPSEREGLKELFYNAGELPGGFPADADGEHEGLWDCYKQTKELNGYLAAMRDGFSILR